MIEQTDHTDVEDIIDAYIEKVRLGNLTKESALMELMKIKSVNSVFDEVDLDMIFDFEANNS